MRILQLSKAYPPVRGGIENNVRDLAEGLAARGHQVDVVVANTRLRTEIEQRGNLRVARLWSPGKLGSMHFGPSAAWWLWRERYDLIHLHTPYPYGELLLWLLRPRAKLVQTWHSDIIRQQRFLKLYAPVERAHLRRVDAVVVTNPRMLDTSPFVRAVRARTHVIHLGIHPAEWDLPATEEDRVRERQRQYGERFALFVGRLVGYKGLEYLLEALPYVAEPLVIVGDGPLRAALTAQAQRLGLSRVQFLGEVERAELRALYHACAFLVLPSVSNNETLGVVQLEAQACGKPCICTDLPTGVPYATLHEQTGLIVPPRDSAALAQAMNRLLRDGELCRQLGAAGRERVRRDFTVEGMLDQFEALYRSLLPELPK